MTPVGVPFGDACCSGKAQRSPDFYAEPRMVWAVLRTRTHTSPPAPHLWMCVSTGNACLLKT
eukprot:365333-Chlamydomonas_euryale.AAC.5